MSVAVPAISHRANFGYDESELYQEIFAYQKKLRNNHHFLILSFAQEITALNPLSILSAITVENCQASASHTLSFYWENPQKHEAILGHGVIQSLSLNSPDRFRQSQQFIDQCFQNIIRIGRQDIEGSSPHIFCGFTFFSDDNYLNSPFPSALLFLPEIQVVKRNNQCVVTLNFLLSKAVNIKLLIQDINRKILALALVEPDTYSSTVNPRKNNKQAQFYTKQNFEKSVASALESIQSKRFSKLVLAHTLDLVIPSNFEQIDCLNNLRNRHFDCYIFSLGNGKGQYFLGASPERLISIKNRQLVTDALAGSAPRGNTPIEDAKLSQALLQSSKERREHQAVIEFITQRLKQLGLSPQLSPLRVLQLSNIQHLWTPIYAQLNSQIHPLEIVAQLHPTPAVAGVPTDIACEEIRRYESFERSLYAAPLGWIDCNGNSEFIVGIRSALISGNQARLYAGAGIVEGSFPDKELAEIQLKFQALLQALLT